MGWTKTSSGNRGTIAGFVIGCRSGKIISAAITSKHCSICTAAEKKCVQPRSHECSMNYHGSSKAMEADAALAMEADAALALVEKLYKRHGHKYYCEALVTDDDSSMRAIVCHPSPKGKGRLPLHIPEPRWLADPSHRTRVVARAIFALAALRQDLSECQQVDALRFKKYFGYMLKQARELTMSDITTRSIAVLEHLFDNHLFCDTEWCEPLRITKLNTNSPINNCLIDQGDHPPSPTSPESIPSPSKPWYYRSKENNPELYDQMKKAYYPYITPERLLQSLHPWDTQLNESLNNVVAKYCPKDRTYSSTMSHSNRISIVIGLHNLDYIHFWSSVLNEIGIPMSRSLRDNLESAEKRKQTKRKYQKKRCVKKKRSKDKHDKMKILIAKQIADGKRGATYRTGIAMDDICDKSLQSI